MQGITLKIHDKAYSEGSDARLSGISASECPYDLPFNQEILRYYWLLGWSDVDKHWGEWAKWEVEPLVPIIEEEQWRREAEEYIAKLREAAEG